MISKIKRLLGLLYTKLFKINDSPQKIALGFSLGVFAGILPGVGPLAALFLAFLCRVNRASALLGVLITNTWISLLTFILSIKIGSAIMGLSWKDAYSAWVLLAKDFHFSGLFKAQILGVIFPVILGYLVISAISGVLAYLAALAILTARRRR
jgi:uncharacterized protein